MHPDATDDDRAYLEGLTRFIDGEVVATVHDRDARGEYPAELVPRLRELGCFSASARDLRTYALGQEELGRGWVSLTPIVNAHSSSVWSIKNYGSAAQREHVLPLLLSGEKIAALALTEPTGGTDLANVASRAERVSEGWRITAHKALITHAEHADALLLLARTDADATPAHRGLSLFLLEKGEWTVKRALPKLGTRAIETVELTVDGIVVPAERLVGDAPGNGFRQIMDALEVGRIAVAAAAVGLGRAALWQAVDYARERRVGGERVADLPAVRSQIAEAANKIAGAKALTLAAAAAKNAGGRHDAETSAAKMLAAEAAVGAALLGMELAGGWGYVEENDFARLLRDSALFIAGEGANGMLAGLVGSAVVASSTNLAWI